MKREISIRHIADHLHKKNRLHQRLNHIQDTLKDLLDSLDWDIAGEHHVASARKTLLAEIEDQLRCLQNHSRYLQDVEDAFTGIENELIQNIELLGIPRSSYSARNFVPRNTRIEQTVPAKVTPKVVQLPDVRGFIGTGIQRSSLLSAEHYVTERWLAGASEE